MQPAMAGQEASARCPGGGSDSCRRQHSQVVSAAQAAIEFLAAFVYFLRTIQALGSLVSRLLPALTVGSGVLLVENSIELIVGCVHPSVVRA